MNKNEYEKLVEIYREENTKLYNELEREKEDNKFFKSKPFKELHNSIYNLGKKSVEDKIKAKINDLKDSVVGGKDE